MQLSAIFSCCAFAFGKQKKVISGKKVKKRIRTANPPSALTLISSNKKGKERKNANHPQTTKDKCKNNIARKKQEIEGRKESSK